MTIDEINKELGEIEKRRKELQGLKKNFKNISYPKELLERFDLLHRDSLLWWLNSDDSIHAYTELQYLGKSVRVALTGSADGGKYVKDMTQIEYNIYLRVLADVLDVLERAREGEYNE